MSECHFDEMFKTVVPIILKLRRSFYIQLWEKEDWLQEGRIVLHQLLVNNPDLKNNRMKLLSYFKTKFTSYVKDNLRYQESMKRRFNRLPYDEISDVAHKIAEDGLRLDDFIAYKDILNHISNQLTEMELLQVQLLMAGERFSGRKKLLRKLKPFFIEFVDQSS